MANLSFGCWFNADSLLLFKNIYFPSLQRKKVCTLFWKSFGFNWALIRKAINNFALNRQNEIEKMIINWPEQWFNRLFIRAIVFVLIETKFVHPKYYRFNYVRIKAAISWIYSQLLQWKSFALHSEWKSEKKGRFSTDLHIFSSSGCRELFLKNSFDCFHEFDTIIINHFFYTQTQSKIIPLQIVFNAKNKIEIIGKSHLPIWKDLEIAIRERQQIGLLIRRDTLIWIPAEGECEIFAKYNGSIFNNTMRHIKRFSVSKELFKGKITNWARFLKDNLKNSCHPFENNVSKQPVLKAKNEG